MTMISISLPDELLKRIERTAKDRRLTLEAYVVDALSEAQQGDASQALDTTDDLDAFVRSLKQRGLSASAQTAPSANLADVLSAEGGLDSLDDEVMHALWPQVEAEAKARARANQLAEGRG